MTGASTGGNRRGPSTNIVSGSWPVNARRRVSLSLAGMEKIGGILGGCFSMTLLLQNQRVCQLCDSDIGIEKPRTIFQSQIEPIELAVSDQIIL